MEGGRRGILGRGRLRGTGEGEECQGRVSTLDPTVQVWGSVNGPHTCGHEERGVTFKHLHQISDAVQLEEDKGVERGTKRCIGGGERIGEGYEEMWRNSRVSPPLSTVYP